MASEIAEELILFAEAQFEDKAQVLAILEPIVVALQDGELGPGERDILEGRAHGRIFIYDGTQQRAIWLFGDGKLSCVLFPHITHKQAAKASAIFEWEQRLRSWHDSGFTTTTLGLIEEIARHVCSGMRNG